MPNAQKSQPYDPRTLQLVHGHDLTWVGTPTGQIIVDVAWLSIPPGNHAKEYIDWLVGEFRAGPGRNAKKAIRSRCYDEGNHVLWDPKPASLKRHIYRHCGVKYTFGYTCKAPGCTQVFPTKDQAVVHAMGHHMKDREKDRTVAADYVVSLYDP